MVNPLLAGPTRRKTDRLDARLLAHHSITGLWPHSFIPNDAGIQLRVLWAARWEAVRAATRCSNRVNNIILRFGHTIAAKDPIRGAMGRALVGELVLGEVPNVPNVAPGGLPPAVRPVVGVLMEDLALNVARAKEAETVATAFVAANKWPTSKGEVGGERLLELLKTVPGVGNVTAMTWISEVVDPKRFLFPEQVSAYCGCDPSVKISAGKVTDYVKRKGNVRLHKALLYAAAAEMRQPESRLAMWGQSIAGRHRKGGYRKALGAMARRIGVGLWRVHFACVPFSLEQYHFGLAPRVADAPIEALRLSPKFHQLLPKEVRTAQDLVDLYWGGGLAPLKGVGQASLKKISDWIKANPAAKAGPRIYLLDRNKNYERKVSGRADSTRRGCGEEAQGSQGG